MSRCHTRIADAPTFRILVAANRIAAPFEAEFDEALDLTLSAWRSMMAPARAPGSSGEAVGRAMGMDRMTVSRSLRRLRGRAERTPEGGRNAWALTAEDWEAFDLVMPRALERDAEVFEDLDARTGRVVTTVLDRI